MFLFNIEVEQIVYHSTSKWRLSHKFLRRRSCFQQNQPAIRFTRYSKRHSSCIYKHWPKTHKTQFTSRFVLFLSYDNIQSRVAQCAHKKTKWSKHHHSTQPNRENELKKEALDWNCSTQHLPRPIFNSSATVLDFIVVFSVTAAAWAIIIFVGGVVIVWIHL